MKKLLPIFAATLASASAVTFERAYDHLSFQLPVQVTHAPGTESPLYLVLQGGQIATLPDRALGEKGELDIVFDISDRPLIDNAFEEGLLSMTFHPDFADNRKVYLYHTIQEPKRSRLTEFEFFADKNAIDPATEKVLLEIPQPYWNHNSGSALFGPDGFLYLGVGDGGRRDDVARLAQNKMVHNGKILRIDVDGTQGDLPYAIPEDNPFANGKGARPEIFAYGLRNPWGLYFDAEGRLWCADVGQDKYEEINFIENGGNYGWSFREGLHKFERRDDAPPKKAKFVDPIFEYDHSEGLSITGGVVYSGEAIPEISGKYIYGDFNFGAVWALDYENNEVKSNVVLSPANTGNGFRPTAFCELPNKEIVMLSHDGRIYDLKP